MKTNEASGRTISASPFRNSAAPFFSKDGVKTRSFFDHAAGSTPFFSPQPAQAKLEIGEPDDIYERQADAVADSVVGTAGAAPPPVRSTPEPSGTDEEDLQRKEDTSSKPATADALPYRLQAGTDGGERLPQALSESMEDAIGADFSHVRVHTDGNAASLSRSISAQAFTTGGDIYFNDGKYDPSSTAGKHLLAHELTHTVQQQASAQRKPVQRKADISMMPGATIQRDIGDFTFWPWATDTSDTAAPDAKVLKKVTAGGTSTGDNFDSSVTVPGPLPTMGDMTVTMRIDINYQEPDMAFIKKNILPTDKTNLKTWEKAIEKMKKTEPEKLKWSEPEKEKIRKDYQQNIDDVWPSDKTNLTFRLNDPEYEQYQVRNNFRLEFTDKSAHHQFSVVKMIDGPTLRSYMGGEVGGFHDSRTFGGTQFNGTTHNMLSDQLGEFDNGSAALTPGIDAQISKLVANIAKIREEHKSDTPAPVWNVAVTGRADSAGNAKQNLRLSGERANAVADALSSQVDTDVSVTSRTDAAGNAAADASSKYRRVEVVFRNTNGSDMNQVTMAHETGHLFGYGDEYGDVSSGPTVLPKYTGDEANETSQAIRDAGMGEDVVQQHKVENNSESIMNRGNAVGAGHYSLFLIQLKAIATDETTSAEVNWQVVKG